MAGWNTGNVTSQVSLSPGIYWLAYLPSDNNLSFVKADDTTSSGMYCSFTYGAMPASFCSPTTSTASHWSFYATLNANSTTTADLNNDGKVNIFDLSILQSDWGTTNTADLNHDGTINVYDLSISLSHWRT